jgi:hypothetical protein
MDTRDERKRTSDDASKRFLKGIGTGVAPLLWDQRGRYLLTGHAASAYRRHESYPGFRTELENRVGDVKGKGASGQNCEAEITEAPIRGGLLRMSDEAE